MAFQRFLLLVSLVLFSSGFPFSSQAYKFYVGGKDGWVLNPSENFNNWAGRNRFQVNDTLYFKYKKGSDSVLVVNGNDYNNCNTKNPIQKLGDGNSDFKFDRSGPFFFISGKEGSCEKGQKLVVTVLAVRQKANTPPATSPTAGAHPPVTSPVPSQSPPSSPSSSPTPSSSKTPSGAPIQPPIGSSATSPSPSSSAPAKSPTSGPSPSSLPPTNSPSGSPVQAPSASSPSPSLPPTNSPSGSPVQAPSASSPSPSANSPSGSPVQAPSAYSPSPLASSPAISPVSSPPALSPSPTTGTPPPAISPESSSTTSPPAPSPGSQNQESTKKSYGVTLSPLIMTSSLATLVTLVLFWTKFV